jgi:hypothetical protein
MPSRLERANPQRKARDCAGRRQLQRRVVAPVKYWEIIARNIKETRLEFGLCLNLGFLRANDLNCRRTSRGRKAFRCAGG